MANTFNRRSLMRGLLGGSAVAVGIPALEIFLNSSGRAYADGAKLPTRIGTYFWGCGLTPGRWVPQKTGANYDVTAQMKPLGELSKKVSVFSNFKVELDGRPAIQHWTGQASVMCGVAASRVGSFERISWDVQAADAIGAGSRFRAIHMTPFGDKKLSYSTRTGQGFNTPETTPQELYRRVFGEGFSDPNDPNWKPDVNTMLRKSVLSGIQDQRLALMNQASAADRVKLDEYYTSIRETEQQLAIQLERPAKCESCEVPKDPGAPKTRGQVDIVNENSKLMAKLTAMALACNQTKIFNVVHSSATSETYLPGDTSIYHSHTHDEPVHPELGYQVVSDKLATAAFQGYSDFLHALEAVKEGDGTLLDNAVVLGFSDTGNAKIHSTENIPMFIGGMGGGRHKPAHYNGNNEPVSRVSLTMQQLAGLPVGQYGVGAMKTSKAITEVIA